MTDNSHADNEPSPDTTPTGPEAPSKPKSGRWLRIALVVSLAFNLLFVGFAGTRAYMHHSGRHHAAGQLGQVMSETRRFIWSLPRERRHELKDLALESREAFRSERENIEEAMRVLAETMAADDFTEESLNAALLELENRAGGLVSRGGETLSLLLLSLSDEERHDLSERMLTRLD